PGTAAAAGCAGTPTTVLPGAWVTVSFSCVIKNNTWATVVTPPQHGTLTLAWTAWNGAAFTYRADPAYRGTDSFTWEGAESGPVTHTLTVEAPPLSCSGVTRPYGAAPPILARDGTDEDIGVVCSNRMGGDQLSLEVVAGPAHGTVTDTSVSSELGLRYRSAPGYVGADSVTVRVKSPVAGRPSPAFEIPITVKGPNRAPVCAPVGMVYVPEATTKILTNLCSDPDGDPLAYGITRLTQLGLTSVGADGSVWYYAYPGARGTETIPVVVGDGFTETRLDVPVTAGEEEPPRAPVPPPVVAPPTVVPPPPPALPAPPDGFVPARGVSLGADAAVWGPLGGIRLGRANLPVFAAGCRHACTLRAQLRLYPVRRGPVALPAQTVRLDPGKRETVRMRLTAAARTAVRGRKRVKAVLSLELQGADGALVRDTLDLRVALPAAAPAAG
ncbi:MAG TPA: Ig-like domain-containing protein, partial [Capillimicrobium sp.]